MQTQNLSLEQLIKERQRLDKFIKAATTAKRRELVKAHLHELKKAGLEDSDGATLRAVLKAGRAALKADKSPLAGQPQAIAGDIK